MAPYKHYGLLSIIVDDTKMRIIAGVLILLLLLHERAYAAEISFSSTSNGKIFISYDGKIEKGDADKLAQLMRKQRYRFLYAKGIVLNSPGGDFDEALRIASLVERAGLRADVLDGEVCASACFFIFVSAPLRLSVGSVIVHRPFYYMAAADGTSGPSYETAYRDAFRHARSYLVDRLVPEYLIEEMMSKESFEGYTLSGRDLLAVGPVSPALSEYEVQVCHMPVDHAISDAETEELDKCVNTYLFQTRLKLLFGSDYRSAEVAERQLSAYVADLRATDPAYKVKSEAFISAVSAIMGGKQPSEWLNLAKEAYAGL